MFVLRRYTQRKLAVPRTPGRELDFSCLPLRRIWEPNTHRWAHTHGPLTDQLNTNHLQNV